MAYSQLRDWAAQVSLRFGEGSNSNTGSLFYVEGGQVAQYRFFFPDPDSPSMPDPGPGPGSSSSGAASSGSSVVRRGLNACEIRTLTPFIPQGDLTTAMLHINDFPPFFPGAIAVALGNDVYFRPGRFTPHTSAGMALVGHELLHVGEWREGRNQPLWRMFSQRGMNFWSYALLSGRYEDAADKLERRIREILTAIRFSGC